MSRCDASLTVLPSRSWWSPHSWTSWQTEEMRGSQSWSRKDHHHLTFQLGGEKTSRSEGQAGSGRYWFIHYRKRLTVVFLKEVEKTVVGVYLQPFFFRIFPRVLSALKTAGQTGVLNLVVMSQVQHTPHLIRAGHAHAPPI